MSIAKARSVIGSTVSQFDRQRCYHELGDAFSEHLCNVTDDPERNLDRVEDQGDGIFVGYHGTTRRLLIEVALPPDGTHAEIVLVATKGQLDVLDSDFGKTGRQVGNTVLVARLLHVGICTLRKNGVEMIVNKPFDARLKQHYVTMGFEEGQRLSLTSEEALRTAFEYIELAYQRHGLTLGSMPP